MVIAWLATRGFVIAMTVAYFEGDCATYFRQGSAWLGGQVPYRDYVVEYPPAAVTVFAALAAAGSYAGFRVLLTLLCIALDAGIFKLLLRRSVGSGFPLGPLAYVAATALLFPVLHVRFDLLPAAATLGACLVLEPWRQQEGQGASVGRLLAGGSLLGLGIAWKLYPLLLLPLLVLRARPGLRQLQQLGLVLAAATSVVGLSLLPALAAGSGAAITSFLRYQGERGLQIESSYASLLVVASWVHPLEIFHQASHHAHDLAGPVPDVIAPWTRLVQATAVILVSLLAWRRRLHLPRAFAAVLAVALATANVLSPQFIVWLVPLAAAALTGPRSRDEITAVVLVAAAGLTSLVFPALYPRLLGLELAAALPLLVRNALLLVLAVRLCARVRDS